MVSIIPGTCEVSMSLGGVFIPQLRLALIAMPVKKPLDNDLGKG